jgi:hypothetical protein
LPGWRVPSATLAGHRGSAVRQRPRAVVRHDRATREVEFNARLHAFARHWRFRPRACAPYRARIKGKDERGVSYVKRNAIAGRAFESWSAFEAHLDSGRARSPTYGCMHGTTGEVPIERFQRAEASALQPIAGIPPYAASRELVRKVQADCAIEVDGNAYSVPWRLIGEKVRVILAGGQLRVSHAGQEVAVHQSCTGQFQRRVDPAALCRGRRFPIQSFGRTSAGGSRHC